MRTEWIRQNDGSSDGFRWSVFGYEVSYPYRASIRTSRQDHPSANPDLHRERWKFQICYNGKSKILVPAPRNLRRLQDYDMDVYLIQHWQDPRLRHNQSVPLSLHSRAHLDRLWVPDVYFSNSKKADYNFVTVPNYVLVIHSDGHIRYSMRYSMLYVPGIQAGS